MFAAQSNSTSLIDEQRNRGPTPGTLGMQVAYACGHGLSEDVDPWASANAIACVGGRGAEIGTPSTRLRAHGRRQCEALGISPRKAP